MLTPLYDLAIPMVLCLELVRFRIQINQLCAVDLLHHYIIILLDISRTTRLENIPVDSDIRGSNDSTRS